MLRDIQRMSWMPSGTGVSIGKSTKSFAVTTAFTPGSASAFEVSMPRITACGCGLRSTLAQIIPGMVRSEEHTSELQSLMRISYAVFCLKKKRHQQQEYTK